MSYTAAQIAEALGVSERAVQKRSNKEIWPSSKRPGKGGGKVFSLPNLPQDVREAMLKWEMKASSPVLAEASQVPAVKAPVDTSLLNTKQRNVMCARLAFVREIERLAAAGMAKTTIMDNLVDASRRGDLAPHLTPMVILANDRSKGERGLSKRSLQRWCSDFAKGGEAALAPARNSKDMGVPLWAADFLAVYQRPSNPTLADSYRQVFGLPHRPKPGAPSIHAVRRFVAKLSIPAREQGRKTGNAWLCIMPHRRRDTSGLWPTDIYTMDGTAFDAEIQHPHTGHPFKPEITLVLDVGTRRCVGMSIALAESAISTLDAIRMACLFGGIPAILHADNGSGYCNAVWTAEGSGLMARLGIELRHSIPGRPIGKGLMERAVGTICVSAAKRLSSCSHADMDKDAAKKVFKLSRKALKNGGNALPTWEEFKRTLLARVEEYNDTPHRGQGMPKIVDEISGRMRPMTPNEAWEAGVDKGFEPVTVPEHMRDELFMPAEHRKVRSGKIKFLGGEYYHADLAELHGQHVEVRYDIWDSAKVFVWSLDGVKICTAKLDAHAAPYFPKAQIEIAQERRKKAQIGRLQVKVRRIEPGATIELPQPDQGLYSDDLAVGRHAEPQPPTIEVQPLPEPHKRPLFLSGDHHYRWLMENRDQCSEADEAWLARYVQGPDYADMADRYAFEKIAYAGPVAQAKEASR
jgi:putative transposase